MKLYKHTVTLVVITSELSPDNVITRAERAFSSYADRAEGSVYPRERAATPFMIVSDPPQCPVAVSARPDYFLRKDEWADNLPTAATWCTQGYA